MPGLARRDQGSVPQRLALKGTIMWDSSPVQASSHKRWGDKWGPACYSAHQAPPRCHHTMRFGSTAKVLLKCKLKYYRISECTMGPCQRHSPTPEQMCWWSSGAVAAVSPAGFRMDCIPWLAACRSARPGGEGEGGRAEAAGICAQHAELRQPHQICYPPLIHLSPNRPA